MESSGQRQPVVNFGVFEFCPDSLELKRDGHRVRIQELPARLLHALLRTPGELVTREQLRTELWPSNTFVQFDAGLNTAMNKLRLALRDSADNPRFVETVPRTGYRFIAPVNRRELAVEPGGPEPAVQAPEPDLEVPPTPEVEAPHLVKTAPMPALPRRRSWVALTAAIAVSGALIIGIIASRPHRSAPPKRLTFNLPPGHEFQYYSGRQIAISPAGDTLAWISLSGNIRQIYVQSVAMGAAFRPLAGTEKANSIAFSPGGDWLAYVSLAGELRKVSLDGRWNVRLVPFEAPDSAGNIAWGDDGWIYFVSDKFRVAGDSVRMFRVRASGGEPELVLPDPQPPGVAYPLQWLPRGVLYTANYTPSDRSVQFWVAGEKRTEEWVQRAAGARYLPTGHLIFSRSGALMAAPFDVGSRSLSRPATTVIPEIAPDRYAGLQMDLSRNGTLVYFRGSVIRRRQPVWVDLQGREEPANLPASRYRLLDMGADGRVLMTRYGAGEQWSIGCWQPESGAWQEIRSGDSPGTGAIWSPDQRSVVLAAQIQHERMDTLYLKPLDPPGSERPLLGDSYHGRYPQSWSRTNAIAYTEGYHGDTRRDIYLLTPDRDAAPRCIACTAADEMLPALSADGRWVTFTSGSDGRFDIFVQRVDSPASPIPISKGGGYNSLWSPSGREIYYRRGDEMWAVQFDPATGRPGASRLLFTGEYEPGSAWNRDRLISPDGKRFLLLKRIADPPEYRQIQVVVNWFEELRRLVPMN